jgi:hypothetical protein
MHFILRILAATAFALAAPAWAQPAADPPAGQAGCEFHVWPADPLMSIYYGWFHGGTVNGQIQGRSGYPTVPSHPIDTATQAAILESTRPHELLMHPDYRLIVHREALTSRAIRNATGRLSDSASPCYAELIVDDVVLQQGIGGTSLNVLFHYRRFDADTRRSSYSTWARTSLTAFPPRRPEQLDEAIREIRDAYRGDIYQFVGMALGPRRH